MKVLFWLATIALIVLETFSIQGVINVYIKNYNGGRQSSSGSIIYYAIGGAILLITAFIFYFTNNIRIAAMIVLLPIAILVLFLFFRLVLPYMMGERMS